MRQCPECNDPLDADAPNSKVYCCRTCLVRARNKRNRPVRLTANIPVAAYTAPVRTPQPHRTVLRARTLADTPDVPAVAAERGDYLTGAAAATMQAVSGARIGVV